MTSEVRVLAVAGSLRKESFNKKLMHQGVEALRRLGAEVDVLDLQDVAMPPYNQDIEDREGLPPGALEFKRRVAEADGLLFVVPEYNYSIPGHFKNVLDWASRGTEDVFRGKIGALMSASPGFAGGLRMNPHLRQVCRALGVLAIHEQVTLPHANKAFAPDGTLAEAHIRHQVEALATKLIEEIRMRKLWASQPRISLLPETEAPAPKPRA